MLSDSRFSVKIEISVLGYAESFNFRDSLLLNLGFSGSVTKHVPNLDILCSLTYFLKVK